MASSPTQRHPKPEDLDPILELIWSGKSLRKACRTLKLHVPTVSQWLHADKSRQEQYARACAGRVELKDELVDDMTLACALGKPFRGVKLDPSALKVRVDYVKWDTARMAPKTIPIQRIAHTFENLTEEELEAAIAAKLAAGGDPSAG